MVTRNILRKTPLPLPKLPPHKPKYVSSWISISVSHPGFACKPYFKFHSHTSVILHLTLPHLSTHVAENPTDPAENKVLKNWSQNSGTKKMYCYLCQSWGNRVFLCMWNRICIFLGITFNFYFNLCVFNNKRAVLQNAKWLYRQFFFYRKSFKSLCIYIAFAFICIYKCKSLCIYIA